MRNFDETAFEESEKLRKKADSFHDEWVQLLETNPEGARKIFDKEMDAFNAWQEYVRKNGHKFLMQTTDE